MGQVMEMWMGNNAILHGETSVIFMKSTLKGKFGTCRGGIIPFDTIW